MVHINLFIAPLYSKMNDEIIIYIRQASASGNGRTSEKERKRRRTMKRRKRPSGRVGAVLLAGLLMCGIIAQGAFPVLAGDETTDIQIETVSQNETSDEAEPDVSTTVVTDNTSVTDDQTDTTEQDTEITTDSTDESDVSATEETETTDTSEEEGTDVSAVSTKEMTEETDIPAADSATEDAGNTSEETTVSETAGEISADTAESSDQTEETEAMPAATFSGTASNGVSVTASAPEGAFPEGTYMSVDAISDDTAMSIARSGSDSPDNVVDSAGVNITFYNAAGQEIEPQNQKSVQVSMTLNSALDGENFYVAHESGGGVSQIAGAGSGSASFAASSFSIYVIYGEDNPAIATYRFIGTDGSVLSEQKVKNGETVYAPETPEKTGYVFSGWTLTDGSEDVDLEAFDTMSAEVTETETLTYYPVFTQYVHIYFMDSTESDARIFLTRTVKAGEQVDADSVILPSDSLHGLAGWYTDPQLTPESRVTTFTASEDLVLYPDIREGHYITYETGSDASVINPVFVPAGEQTVAPEDPTRAGYTFEGFATSPDATSPDFTFGGTLDQDITLYAIWTPAQTTYTVIIWKQSISDDRYAAEADRTYDYVESVQREATVGETVSSSVEDTEKAYTGFHYSRSTTTTASADGKAVVNVYYDRNLITFYFINQDDTPYCDPWEGLFGQPISQYGYVWEDLPGMLWGNSKSGYGGFINMTSFDISQYTDNNYYIFYYCEKTASPYKARFYLQNETGDGYTLAAESSRLQGYVIYAYNFYEGYQISYYRTQSTEDDSWSEWQSITNNGESLGMDCNLEIRFDRNDYQFNYYSYNNEVKSETVMYGSSLSGLEDYVPDRPEELPDYYSFQGWYKDAACTEAFDFSESMPAYDVTAYAKWAPKTCKVTAENTTLTVQAGDKIDPDALPTVVAADGTVIENTSNPETITVPDGETWGGWAVQNSDGSRQLFIMQSRILDDTVLTPYFIDGRSVHVTYSVNGDTDLVTDSRSFTPDSTADVLSGADVTAPAGSVFLYWSTSEDGSGEAYYPGESVNVGDGITLYAVFGDTAKTTVLTYHNGTESTQQKVNGSTDLTNNTAFALYQFADTGFTAKQGMRFTGWNTKEDGSGQHFDPGAEVGVDNLAANDLYAEWEVVTTDNQQKTDTVTTANKEAAALTATTVSDTATDSTTAPDTGDSTNIIIWFIVIGCAALAAGLLIRRKISGKKK